MSTKLCDLYAEMVQCRQILSLYTTTVHIANACGYKILRFWVKYQTLVPAKISHSAAAGGMLYAHNVDWYMYMV